MDESLLHRTEMITTGATSLFKKKNKYLRLVYVDEQQSHDMVAESELVVGAEETEGLSWDFCER